MTGLNQDIEIHCEQMVDLLLSRHELEIENSLMYAILENQYSIVVKLIDILQSENPENGKLGYEYSTNSYNISRPLCWQPSVGM
jgi:hypothetical protein